MRDTSVGRLHSARWRPVRMLWIILCLCVILGPTPLRSEEPARNSPSPDDYAKTVRPLVEKYCTSCHSTKDHKAGLDLERFVTAEHLRKDVKPWQMALEMLEVGEMPPKKKPQPTDAERAKLINWTRGFLTAEARARAGDPGVVPMRRLSNAEYDNTIRDLTGVDLKPARDFPFDGAAGEGFTNASEALADLSPTRLVKYFNAAKEISSHAVLLPEGFRFSVGKTRRDWTDEATAELRKFYAEFAAGDGKFDFKPYLLATVRHREPLKSGAIAVEAVAAKEKLNAKYLGLLWAALNDQRTGPLFVEVRRRWGTATEKDVPALAAEITAWQAALWKTAKIGSYSRTTGKGQYVESLTRQVPANPVAADSQTVRLAIKPPAGSSDITVNLLSRELSGLGREQRAVWHRPRFEAAGKPTLLLKDYEKWGPAYSFDYPSAFVNAAKYLDAVRGAAINGTPANELAADLSLDPVLLKNYVGLLALERARKNDTADGMQPVAPLTRLEDTIPANPKQPGIIGWRKKGTDLPVVLANSTDTLQNIPARVPAHKVAMHPMPTEFVGVTWKAPTAGVFHIAATIAHAHPACGNGVAWRLEHRRADRGKTLAAGDLPLGKGAETKIDAVTLEAGDLVVLIVDAKEGNHFCDMTQVDVTVTQTVTTPARVWDLAGDLADTISAANPHADRQGNKDVWGFVRGDSTAAGAKKRPGLASGSVLDQWRNAASDPARKTEASELAQKVQALLSGKPPADPKSADRTQYDMLVATDSPLWKGVDLAKVIKPRAPDAPKLGLPPTAFGKVDRREDAESLYTESGTAISIRLPAGLFRDYTFVADGRTAGGAPNRVTTFSAWQEGELTPPVWDGQTPLVGSPAAVGQLLKEFDQLRALVPLYLCFPPVIPTDEVVSLKMFHREDDALVRLFLSDEQAKKLDQLWAVHRFVSRQPVAENAYLPQFIGFVTQDQPKEMVAYYEGQRPVFAKRAAEFLAEEEAAIPKQLDALIAFAAKAYRRPLDESELAGLRSLYQALRDKGRPHEEAFRAVIGKVLVSPTFLMRSEKAPPGTKPGAVDAWELATRLSYFLWSAPPDDELRAAAASGKLIDSEVLAAQTKRMLADARTRALATEFGTQWIHVRGFDSMAEKNERLFPTFTAELRGALYEEAILFFLDLFTADRPATHLLDADATFLNEKLAKHYEIPGISGPQFRRVEGVRKFGRGGLLGLGSVQAKQSAASRTSPVLRGNWVVETLLGEKLPRPPADVPQLPEKEGDSGLTVRELTERHTKQESCAVCHVRIDPFGLAMERYDAIGRFRDKDLLLLPIDAKTKLRDGTEIDGLDGLRDYLLTKKKDVFVRLFCKRLLGYALCRSTILSDDPLIDDMAAALHKPGGRMSDAVLMIVRSPQFRFRRSTDEEEPLHR